MAWCPLRLGLSSISGPKACSSVWRRVFALHAAPVNNAEFAAVVVIYTLIATSTVVVPIIASFLAPKKVQPKLMSARDWISVNGRVLTSAMMFMIGVVIFGAGLTHL